LCIQFFVFAHWDLWLPGCMAMLDLGSTCKWVQVPLFLALPFLRLRVWGPDFLFFLVGTDSGSPANAASLAGIFLGHPRPRSAGGSCMRKQTEDYGGGLRACRAMELKGLNSSIIIGIKY
jgi:hypothetical protein